MRPGMWRLPNWLAISVIILCVAGAVAGMWWWMRRETVDVDVLVVDAPQRLGRNPATRPLGIVKEKDSVIQARAGGIEVRLKAEDKGFVVRPAMADRWLTPQEEQLRRIARRLMQSPGLAKRIQLTPEQQERLKKLDLDSTLNISDADRTRLEALVKAWQETGPGQAKVAAERALVGAMKEIGVKAVAATQEAVQGSVREIRAILTPGQIEQCKGFENKANSGRPATRPVRAGKGG